MFPMNMRMGPAYEMRTRHEEMNRRDKVKHPISGEAVGLGEYDQTLQQIFDNKRTYDLFLNVFLYGIDSAMARQIALKRAQDDTKPVKDLALSESEEKFLEDGREKFNIARAEAGQVRALLTDERLKVMARADKDLDEMIGAVGTANAAEHLGAEIDELAFTDAPKFRRLVDSIKAAADVQDGREIEMNQRRVERALRRYGVTRDQYVLATKTGTGYESQRELSGLVRQRLTGFWKALDFVSAGAVSRFGGQRLHAGFAETTRLMERADEHLADVIKILRASMDERFRLGYQTQAWTGKAPEAVRYNVVTIADYKRIRDEYAVDSIEADFKKYRAREAKKFGSTKSPKRWDDTGSDLDDAAKDKIRAMYADEKERGHHALVARGVMRAFLADMFPSSYKADLEAKIRSIA